jgi:hypothetical protein
MHLAVLVLALQFEAITAEQHVCRLVIHPFFGAG